MGVPVMSSDRRQELTTDLVWVRVGWGLHPAWKPSCLCPLLPPLPLLLLLPPAPLRVQHDPVRLLYTQLSSLRSRSAGDPCSPESRPPASPAAASPPGHRISPRTPPR